MCRRGCTVSPEKGGALRNQSTGGRRLGVAAVICGVLFGAPLLLLQNSSATASRAVSGPHHRRRARRTRHARRTCRGRAPRRRLSRRWCELAVAPGRVSSAREHDDVIDDDDRATEHDDDHAAPDNDNRRRHHHHHHLRRPRRRCRRRRTAKTVMPRGMPRRRPDIAPARRFRSVRCSPSPTTPRAHRRRARWTTGKTPATRGSSTCRPRASRRSQTRARGGGSHHLLVTHSGADIARLLSAHGIRPSKALGQNFVADPNTVRRIARLAGRRPGIPGPRDRRRPRIADPRPGRDRGTGGGGGGRPPPLPGPAWRGRTGRRRGRRGRRHGPRPGRAAGGEAAPGPGTWWPTCPTTWPPRWSCGPWWRCPP